MEKTNLNIEEYSKFISAVVKVEKALKANKVAEEAYRAAVDELLEKYDAGVERTCDDWDRYKKASIAVKKAKKEAKAAIRFFLKEYDREPFNYDANYWHEDIPECRYTVIRNSFFRNFNVEF